MTQQNTNKLINKMVNRLNLVLDEGVLEKGVVMQDEKR